MLQFLRAINFCLNFPNLCSFIVNYPVLSLGIGAFFVYFIRRLPLILLDLFINYFLPFLFKRVFFPLLLFLWVLLNRILKHLYVRYKKRIKSNPVEENKPQIK